MPKKTPYILQRSKITAAVTHATINRCNDAFAKYIFMQPDHTALIDFLNCIFEHEPCPAIKGKIVALEFNDRETLPDDLRTKICHFDVTVTTDQGVTIDLEFQNYFEKDYLVRALAYYAKLFFGTIDSGQDYGELKPVIVVSLLSFQLFAEEEGWHPVVELRMRRTGNLATDKLCLQFLQPHLCSKIGDEGSPRLKMWMDFLMNSNTDAVDEFAARDQIFGDLMEKEMRFLGDRQMRIHYAKVEREISDRNSLRTHGYKEGKAEGISEGMEIGIAKGRVEGLAEGRAQGREQGHAEGRKEAIHELALKMLAEGDSPEHVHKLIGLSFDEIALLQQ